MNSFLGLTTMSNPINTVSGSIVQGRRQARREVLAADSLTAYNYVRVPRLTDRLFVEDVA
jgi:hypothetical protein